MNILHRSREVRRGVAVACGVLASLFVCGTAAAQFGPSIELPPGLPTAMPAPPAGYPPTVAPTAVGPYYVPPASTQTLATNVRFVILSNFNSEAVLDRVTGLVWARRNGDIELDALLAVVTCQHAVIGGRMGWRLPSVRELFSLIDSSVPYSGQPILPVGHPFELTPTIDQFYYYWTSDIIVRPDETVRLAVEMSSSGSTSGFRTTDFRRQLPSLCVRGTKRSE